eukprot:COSAG04_NODE_341_length_16294_cov_8.682618_14_plen_2365_part_00
MGAVVVVGTSYAPDTLALSGRLCCPDTTFYFALQPELRNDRPYYATPDGNLYLYWDPTYNDWNLDINELASNGVLAYLPSSSLAVPLGSGAWMDASADGDGFEDNPLFTIAEMLDAVWGCKNSIALNFDAQSTADDGSCTADLALVPNTLALSGLLCCPDTTYDFALQPQLQNNRPYYATPDGNQYLYWDPTYDDWNLDINELASDGVFAYLPSSSLAVPLGSGAWMDASADGDGFEDNPLLTIAEVSDAEDLNLCAPFSETFPDTPLGYHLANPSATTVSGLGIRCAVGYTGVASVLCESDGASVDDSWRSIAGRDCGRDDKIGTYASRVEAMAACGVTSSCATIYDQSCDNSGPWTMCSSGSGAPSFSGSCLYAKPADWVVDAQGTQLANLGIGNFSSPSGCVPCAPGRFSSGGQFSFGCVICPAGTFAAAGAGDCTSCDVGKFSEIPGIGEASGCTDCEAGKYVDVRGSDEASDCIDCNSFATVASVLDNTCTACTGPQPAKCSAATCASGHHSYANGSCCEDFAETRVGADCVCSEGFSSSGKCARDMPCAAGSMPSANQTSDDCISCPVGRASPDGLFCKLCNGTGEVSNPEQSSCVNCIGGKAPAVDRSTCESCNSSSYSAFGIACVDCVAPNVISDGRTRCSACAAGTGPNADHSGCEGCPDGFYSVFGVCQECLLPSMVSADRASCEAPSLCNAGTECSNENGCDDQRECALCGAGQVSTSGGECRPCDDAGKVASRDQSFCTSCPAGKAPWLNGSGCGACVGATYSTFGIECSECASPNVVNAERTACTPCLAGSGPNDAHDACEECPVTTAYMMSTVSMYSTFGVCQECSPPNIVSDDYTSCNAPFKCASGTQCTRSRCASQSECSGCATGYVSSDGSLCVMCDEPGKVANAVQSACEPCQAGKMPSSDRSACEECVGTTTSGFGIDCQDCPSPSVVNLPACTGLDDGSGRACALDMDGSGCVIDGGDCSFTAGRTICSACAAGRGPNKARTGCEACAGSNFSAFGIECSKCVKPNVINGDRTSCSPCGPGTGPNPARDGCEDCTGTNYSAFGIRCSECEPPRVVTRAESGAQIGCASCGPGQGPNTNGTECEACVGTTYSRTGECEECNAPHIIDSAHLTCTSCAPGEQPNDDRTACIACAGTNYSAFGIKCAECAEPSVINVDRTSCTACAAGTGPNVDRNGCEDCPDGFYSTFGLCQTCMQPNVVSDDRASCNAPFQCNAGTECKDASGCDDQDDCFACGVGNVSVSGGGCQPCAGLGAEKVANDDQSFCESCLPGRAPEANRSTCSDCTGTHYSAFGIRCSECEPPRVVTRAESGAQIGCASCGPGQGPNTNGTECEACVGTTYSRTGECEECNAPHIIDSAHLTCTSCAPGEQPNDDRTACIACAGTNYSAFGIKCAECAEPSVINVDRTSCTACAAGTGPNVDRNGCEDCPDGFYSTFGACQECIAPSVVSGDRTSCTTPSMCEAGTECRHEGGCGVQRDCTPCTTGNVSSTGGFCQPCGEPGKVTNAGQTFCQSCGPGKAPSDDRSACVSCVFSNYSAFGIECSECEEPNVVNEDRTSCSACPAGKGPSSARMSCEACVGTTYSTIGQCQECAAPNIVDGDHLSCSKCLPGHMPNGNRTECIACLGTSYSAFGVECTGCTSPNVVNDDRTSCSACSAGSGPSVARTSCDSCSGTTYSAIGQCQDCGVPNVVDDDHLSCTKCMPGQMPNENRTRCIECIGTSYSAFGASCTICQPPNVVDDDRTSCSACPAGRGPSTGRTECNICNGTTYSTIGQCQDCGSPRIVDSSHLTCSSCFPGEMPDANRTGCIKCGDATYSPFGVDCTVCPRPNVVNGGRTTCSPCPAGRKANTNRTGCTRCTGNAVSITGTCSPCGAGQAANENKTQCNDLGEAQVTDSAVVADVLQRNGSNVLPLATLRLQHLDVSVLTKETARTAFITAFKRDLAAVLGVTEAIIRVTGFRVFTSLSQRRQMQSEGANATSATIDFTVDSLNAAVVLRHLSEQMKDPGSSLRSSRSVLKFVNFEVPMSFAFVCPRQMMRAAGAAQCSLCPANEIVNSGQTACEPCSAGRVPADDQTECVCEAGSYESGSLPVIHCFEVGWYERPLAVTNGSVCHVCPSGPVTCLDCNASGVISLVEGYQLLVGDAPVSQTRSAFKCPIKGSCPAQVLTAEHGTLVAANCTEGHTGKLCGSCLTGWKKGATGKCRECTPSTSGFINPLFLIPFAVALAYVVFRKLLAYQREQRQVKLGSARKMFEDMDTNKSGALSRTAMRKSLSLLGLNIDEDTAAVLVEDIDVDHSGDIDVHEFSAWMEHKVSSATMALVVAKIVLGLGQVVSKQPEVVKEEFPGPQW